MYRDKAVKKTSATRSGYDKVEDNETAMEAGVNVNLLGMQGAPDTDNNPPFATMAMRERSARRLVLEIVRSADAI